MFRKHRLLLVAVWVGASLLVAACGGTPAAKSGQLDSGPADAKYQGVAQPLLPEKKLKLTEDELKNGVKKFPLKSSTGQTLQPEVEVKDTPTIETEGQAGDVAKPQV